MESTSILPKRWVYKSNEFLQARYDWTAQEHRIVAMLISQLDRNQEDFGVQRVYISELEETAGIKNPNLYSNGKHLAKSLLDKKIEVPQANSDDYEGYNLLSAARYVSGRGCIEARFNPDMREFLLRLQKRWTKYLLQQVMPLSSPYAIRFYEICAMYRNLGWVDLSVEEIRRRFKLEDKYSRYRDLRRYVIDAAREELIEHRTDLYFTYTERRRGRAVTALKLRIHALRTETPSPTPSVNIDDERDASQVWFDELPADMQTEVLQEARRRLKLKYPELTPRLAEAYLHMEIGMLYREAVEGQFESNKIQPRDEANTVKV